MSTRLTISGSRDSGTCRQATASTSAATGTLITKISRHDTAWISQPPRNGPIAVPTPLNPDQAPIALPRSSGVNDASMIARLPGVSKAAPTPCSALAATRTGAFGATPQITDASANQTTPIRNTDRRPYRSPRDPASSSRPARVSV